MKDIDQYGQYTVDFWFSNGDIENPNTETFENKGLGKSLTIMSYGLAGEVGEVMEKIKKQFRDDTVDIDGLKLELGDVAFYWARICRYYGLNPSEVLAANIAKLDSRRARGTKRGSGDYR